MSQMTVLDIVDGATNVKWETKPVRTGTDELWIHAKDTHIVWRTTAAGDRHDILASGIYPSWMVVSIDG